VSIKEQAALAKASAQEMRRARPELYPTYLELCEARHRLAVATRLRDRLERLWAEECGETPPSQDSTEKT
jgi:hypothetical protein